MSLVTEKIRKAAKEIHYGNEKCKERSQFLLSEVGLPNGLLPLKDIEECGYVEETGFVWLKQKKKCEHVFKKIDKHVTYGTEVTAYVEKGKIKKLTGVKTKELFMWVTLSDIYLDDPPTGKINFKISSGLFRTFPASAFEAEDVEDGKKLEEMLEPKLELGIKEANGTKEGVDVDDEGVEHSGPHNDSVGEEEKTEVTAYVEKGRIKKFTGVKTKELFMWVTLSDIYLENPPTGKITFKISSGLYRSFQRRLLKLKMEETGGNG
ncbi:hypothetical protein POM88_024093 [Heracleum sosnowskyi]|uniref:Uncharacterized protein n=1 Tax=Heracleum sosnowskyi TaxID=360622 RepID=A0AAD8MWK5_9APIA|nr:hypothetical protein POM88_024093 [Heracleum sosnowskyi]